MDKIQGFFSNTTSNFTIIQMLVPAFMAILFGQSGLDKVFNYQGNLSYITDHFKNSPLSKSVKFMMLLITLLEVKAGILCAIGTILIPLGNTKWAFWGVLTAAIALLCLFFGQRMAKDYGGAASLVTYFILAVFGLLLLS